MFVKLHESYSIRVVCLITEVCPIASINILKKCLMLYYLANNLDAEMEADQEEEEKFWYSILENLDTHPSFFTLLVRLLCRID